MLLAFLAMLIVLVPIAFSARWAWRRGNLSRSALAAFTFGLVWVGVEAVYPSESFYRSEFKRLTELPLTEGAKFLEKTATFPDHFGDYSACFVVALESNEIFKITEIIASTPKIQESSIRCDSKDMSAKSEGHLYDISRLATRSDAKIYITTFPKLNLLMVSWRLW